MRASVSIFCLLSLVVLPFMSNQALASRCEILFFDLSLQSDRVTTVPASEKGTGFIVPNEKNIGAVRATFAEASAGIYVSVGTERGFMGAALTGQATKALVLVDVDPRAFLFNLLNKSLLQLATDRRDYLELRLRSSFATIALRAKNSSSISSESRELLSHPEHWIWWTRHVQRHSEWREFHDPAQPAYRDANYLFDDGLFNSLSALAKQGRIFVYNSNLKADGLRTKLFGLARALNMRLSVLDFSNAWDEGYLGLQVTVGILNSVREITDPKTYFVFTYVAANPDARETSSIFKYWIIRSESVEPEKLASILGGFMRADPSRGVGTTRSPVYWRSGHF